MASIAEITQQQSYLGNANLGGGTSGVITVDPSPVMDLARFTMFANKADYDQRQKDVDAKVADLAELTALDLNAAIGKDKEELTKDYTAILEKDAREYATYEPTSQQDKLDKMLAFNDKVAKLKSKLKSATGRAISYVKQKEDLKSSSFSPEERKRRQDLLDKKFSDTDIFTPVSAMDNYKFTLPTIPDSPEVKFDVTQKGDNGAVIATYGLIDGAKADAIASSLELGFNVKPLPANPTPEQIEEYNQRKEAFDAGGASVFNDAARMINEAMSNPKYKDANLNIDWNAIKSSNRLLADNIAQIEYMNNYNKDVENKIKSGSFFDKTGIKPVAGFLNESGYSQVDLTKPITAKDLIKAEIYRKANSNTKVEKFVETDDEIQRKQLALGWYNAETGRLTAKGKDVVPAKVDAIQRPALFLAKNIENIKYWFNKPENKNDNKPLVVQYNAVDETTRIAVGMKPGQEIIYNRDGSYKINDKSKKQVSVGTMENLVQGYIDAVKDIQIKKEGASSIPEGWQIKAEEGFKMVFGTNVGSKIWGGGQQTDIQTKTGADGKVYSSSDGVTWTAEDGTTVTLKKK